MFGKMLPCNAKNLFLKVSADYNRLFCICIRPPDDGRINGSEHGAPVLRKAKNGQSSTNGESQYSNFNSAETRGHVPNLGPIQPEFCLSIQYEFCLITGNTLSIRSALSTYFSANERIARTGYSRRRACGFDRQHASSLSYRAPV